MPLFSEILLRLFYPAACVLCRKDLRLHEKTLCAVCFASFERFELRPRDAVWRLSASPRCEGFSLYEYRSSMKDFLTHFKFNRQPWLIKALRPRLAKFLLAVQLETRYDALTPVPMTLRRFLERHYNPAEVLAGEIGCLSGLQVLPLLEKNRSTPPQHALSGEERRANLRGSFSVKDIRQAAGRKILLIDDILTTGSTAREAARALKEAGAKRVGILTLARTLELKHSA